MGDLGGHLFLSFGGWRLDDFLAAILGGQALPPFLLLVLKYS